MEVEVEVEAETEAGAEAGAVRTAPAPLRQAQAEGLTLRVGRNSTGYFGVCHEPTKSLPYRAQLKSGGKKVCLGNFATAEEAALCVARSPEGQSSAQAAEVLAAAVPPSLTSEEAVRQAQEEGLPLLKAFANRGSTTGYHGVHIDVRSQIRPFSAQVWRDSKQTTLGHFATAEEAALYVARSPEGQVASKRAAAYAEGLTPRVPEAWPEVKAEILCPKLERAEAELLTLLAAQDAAASKAAVEASGAKASALGAAQERHIVDVDRVAMGSAVAEPCAACTDLTIYLSIYLSICPSGAARRGDGGGDPTPFTGGGGAGGIAAAAAAGAGDATDQADGARGGDREGAAGGEREQGGRPESYAGGAPASIDGCARAARAGSGGGADPASGARGGDGEGAAGE